MKGLYFSFDRVLDGFHKDEGTSPSTSDPFEDWIDSFPSLTDPADKTKTANPDGGRLNNFGEFALDGDPTTGNSSGKYVGKIAQVGGVEVFTLTFPARVGAVLSAADPAGGELVLEQSVDGLFYTIQAGDSDTTGGDLSFPDDVSEISGADTNAIQAGLPAVNAGWGYRTFRGPDIVSPVPTEFMRVLISE